MKEKTPNDRAELHPKTNNMQRRPSADSLEMKNTGNRESKKEIGQKLKAIREKKGLSAYAVARDGSITIGQVKAVEAGESNYTIDIFLGYLNGVGVGVSFLEN